MEIKLTDICEGRKSNISPRSQKLLLASLGDLERHAGTDAGEHPGVVVHDVDGFTHDLPALVSASAPSRSQKRIVSGNTGGAANLHCQVPAGAAAQQVAD